MRYFTREQYISYLRSPEWSYKRDRRLEIDGNVCRGCGKPNSALAPLEVHHVNYYSFGFEDVHTDLISLCPECHRLVHRIMCRPTGNNADGSIRYGWQASLPDYISEDLRSRGLME